MWGEEDATAASTSLTAQPAGHREGHLLRGPPGSTFLQESSSPRILCRALGKAGAADLGASSPVRSEATVASTPWILVVPGELMETEHAWVPGCPSNASAGYLCCSLFTHITWTDLEDTGAQWHIPGTKEQVQGDSIHRRPLEKADPQGGKVEQ